jgi:tetratricopeptide (TPR) repeat protein
MRFAGRVFLVGFALLAGAPARADDAEAMSNFAEAKAAFAAEDFSKARVLFERALETGMAGPAIHYNIAAASYLGGDLPRAEREFREVARTPSMAPLAHYNLGLVALERRDEREAREWFQRTIQESPDERLVELARQRLADLPEPRAWGAWSYYTRGGVGYDDNIALRSSSIEGAATGNEDAYAELIFGGNYSIGQWHIDTGGGILQYMSQDEFSQSAFSVGGARGFSRDNWYFELGVYGAQFSLGGDVFERDLTAAAQVTRTFYEGSRLRAQIRATSFDGKSDFSGLTGERQEFGLYYDWGREAWRFGAHARAEINDSEDVVFETRWIQLGAEARYSLSPLWGLTAIAAMRQIHHPAQSETLDAWNDNRATIQVGVTRALWRRTQLFVRFEHQRNDSPVVGYDYERNWVAASVETWR